ncbi:MAG: RNA polymerase sigma factor [Proteobacteria bacterium]|nr:RNA polymerase sigma factor [Pseudomonadota bacterium]
MNPYPFSEHSTIDDSDDVLVGRAREGDHSALDTLVRRHQAWIYNLAIRMLYQPEDAADATQEILVKVVTRISSFEGRSAFRTWLYRIATNHLLNQRKLRKSLDSFTFQAFEATMSEFADADVPASRIPARLLVKESLIGCTSAMLLCLSSEQRMVYILGAVFGATDRVAAAILGLSPAAYRKRLSRARSDLHAFMSGQCGLIDRTNPCRCEKKTRAFIEAGHIDPDRLMFADERLQRIREVIPAAIQQLDAVNCEYARLYREHYFYQPPEDYADVLGELIRSTRFQALVHATGEPASNKHRGENGPV